MAGGPLVMGTTGAGDIKNLEVSGARARSVNAAQAPQDFSMVTGQGLKQASSMPTWASWCSNLEHHDTWRDWLVPPSWDQAGQYGSHFGTCRKP